MSGKRNVPEDYLYIRAEKALGEDIDFSIDWEKVFELVIPNDSIASPDKSTWTLTGTGGVLGTTSVKGMVTTAWVSGGGKTGNVLRLTNTVETVGGRTHTRLIIIKIVNQLAAIPATATSALSAGTGNVEGTDVKSTEIPVGYFLGANGDGTSSWKVLAGGGDALTANPLSQFAATTLAQLNGVISDATLGDSASFATTAQGAKADTAVQPGGNISVFTNDSGYQANAPLASQAEAEAGIENTKTMTALRVAQAIAALGGSSPLVAKGDLYGFSTVNARVPVGTDGFILTADSTQALGVKWAANTGGGGDLKADGTVPLTANWDAGSFDITAEQFHSDIITGTAPFTVASTTVVANLNADLLDGNEATAFATSVQGAKADTAIQRDGSIPLTANWDAGSFDITAEQFHSDIITGTSPFTVASTTVVANLNADQLDGNDASDFATALQGAKADTALQSGDNVSTLVNDSGYITDVVSDTTPQLGGNLDIQAFDLTSSEGFNSLHTSDSVANTIFMYASSTGGLTRSSGGQSFLRLQPTLKQTGTAKYVALDIAVTETTTGSGWNYLIEGSVGGTHQFGITPAGLFYANGTLNLLERAAAAADTADYGQIWVKAGAPNTLWFTDDAGTDFQLGVGGGGDVVDDTTPQLGGNLDTNDFSILNAEPTSDVATTQFLIEGQSAYISAVTNTSAGNLDLKMGDHATAGGSAGLVRILAPDDTVAFSVDESGNLQGKQIYTDVANTNHGYGYGALQNLGVSADSNTAVGHNAGATMVNADHNTLIGRNAGQAINISDSHNTFIGSGAGAFSTNAVSSVMIGSAAGGKFETPVLTDSVVIGRSAGELSSSLVRVVAVGHQALHSASGADNIGIGYTAGNNITTGTNNIVIGAGVGALVVTDNDQLVIGNSGSNSLAGYMGARSDVDYSAKVLTITGPSAYTSASTNQDGGDLILQGGQKASGGGTSGNVIAKGLIAEGAVYNAQTGTTYTLVASDNGKTITFSQACTVTLPDTLDTNFQCTLMQIGTGTVTLTNTTDTINGATADVTTSAQWNAIYLSQYEATKWVALVEEGGFALQGKQTIWVPAGAMRPTVSNGCAAITDVETTAGRPDMTVLDFDSTADEHAQFQVAFPKSWNKGTITFQIFWTSTAIDADGVTWALQGVACSDGDTLDVAYGTAVTIDDLNQSTAEDLYVTAESTAVTIAGTPAVDDECFFRIFRDVSAANDTATEDARLLGVKLFYTTDAGNDV